ncbi:MAG: hypothetical protein RSG56_07810, partial [Brevundimonas sp.]
LTASERIEANHKGELAVYQSQAVYGQAGQGGTLNLTTPLLTGQAGSSLHYKAGGAINLTAPAGATASPAAKPQLGAEIKMTAASITADGDRGRHRPGRECAPRHGGQGHRFL